MSFATRTMSRGVAAPDACKGIIAGVMFDTMARVPQDNYFSVSPRAGLWNPGVWETGPELPLRDGDPVMLGGFSRANMGVWSKGHSTFERVPATIDALPMMVGALEAEDIGEAVEDLAMDVEDLGYQIVGWTCGTEFKAGQETGGAMCGFVVIAAAGSDRRKLYRVGKEKAQATGLHFGFVGGKGDAVVLYLTDAPEAAVLLGDAETNAGVVDKVRASLPSDAVGAFDRLRDLMDRRQDVRQDRRSDRRGRRGMGLLERGQDRRLDRRERRLDTRLDRLTDRQDRQEERLEDRLARLRGRLPPRAPNPRAVPAAPTRPTMIPMGGGKSTKYVMPAQQYNPFAEAAQYQMFQAAGISGFVGALEAGHDPSDALGIALALADQALTPHGDAADVQTIPFSRPRGGRMYDGMGTSLAFSGSRIDNPMVRGLQVYAKTDANNIVPRTTRMIFPNAMRDLRWIGMNSSMQWPVGS